MDNIRKHPLIKVVLKHSMEADSINRKSMVNATILYQMQNYVSINPINHPATDVI